MSKKLLFSLLLSIVFLLPAHADENFSAMNPTVKVTAYKKLYTGRILGIASGSGTVITADGLILTNHHVIFDENEQKPLDAFAVCVTFDVQKEPVCKYTASLVANDKDFDLAILKLDAKDVFGKTLPALKYLDYQNGVAPKEQTQVQVVGYPGSGGETITITKGQISGFDQFNSHTYFKTDTDFDHGSSGGTALDMDGHYIGIPTYIRSYAENVGYFLDLREALPWIREHLMAQASPDGKTGGRLRHELARLETANENRALAYSEYPGFSITLPEDWKFYEVGDEGFYAEQEKQAESVGLSVYFNPYQFEVDKRYMDKLDEELAKLKKEYPDYKKEEAVFAGQKAWKLTYSAYNQRQYAYYIPYGYCLLSLHYAIRLDEEEKQLRVIQPVLDSIELTLPPQTDPKLSRTIAFDDPPFEIAVEGRWRAMKNPGNHPLDLLAEAVREGNFDGFMRWNYRQTPKDERKLSPKDRMDEATKGLEYSDSKLIYKKEDVVADGLTGFLYTYEYEGEKYQEMHKRLTLTLQNGDYEFKIIYDDLSANFDKNLDEVKAILESFRFRGGDETRKGTYDFGPLDYSFSDVQYHRFAGAIGELADKGIVQGYPDGTFRPEKPITRAEALKIILISKNHMEKERGLGKEVNFTRYAAKDAFKFRDVAKRDWSNKFVQYAAEKEILSGYADKTFRPDNPVTTVEALKMMMGVYEIPLWQGETNPWYKKYMEKGYELYLIPRGLEDPNHKLTRGELAYIVNSVYSQAK
ncbi:S-layer homology domain-containing protein [Candidatus Peregrinibacteria bacterium]|nr:S-layer homology domain-containing protein [Candidatus Peregrinibacteria bacterium]